MLIRLIRLGASQVFLAGLITFWCILVKCMFADIVLKNVSISLLVKLLSLTILFKSFCVLKIISSQYLIKLSFKSSESRIIEW